MAVYLIGGPPKCGKTTLAKALCMEHKIPWISSDTIENIVWAYSPKKQHPDLFPHRYLRGESNDEFYAQYPAEDIVRGYTEQSKATYDAIRMMAGTYLTDEDDFIVEGYQVTPEIVREILDKFGNEHIKTAFLIKKNEEQLMKDFLKSTTPNDWILRKTINEATFAKIAHMIAVYSDYIEREAIRYELPLLEMDTNFSSSLEEAMNFLVQL